AVGKKVLIIDLDPQGNASTGLGVEPKDRAASSYELLIGAVSVLEAARPTSIPNLSIIPSTIDLSGAELELVSADRRCYRLRDSIFGGDRAISRYDYVLTDCPPALNLLTLNALTAAQSVLV